MAIISRIAGRSVFYLILAVLSDLHRVMKTCAVDRKAGNTKAEALRNKTIFLVAEEQLFKENRGFDPAGSTFGEVRLGADAFGRGCAAIKPAPKR